MSEEQPIKYAYADKYFYQSDYNYERYKIDFVANLDSSHTGIIALSGSEMETDTIFGELIKACQPWCEENNKKFYVMSPTQLHHCKYPNKEYPCVEWLEFHGYDIMLYNVKDLYLESKKEWGQFLPQKLFTCYNNRYSYHRTRLIRELEDQGMLGKGHVSYNKGKLGGQPYKTKDGISLGIENFQPNETDEWHIHRFPEEYFTGLIDIVTESRYLPGEYYMSEKTFKPIIGQKPFLVVSSQGYHRWLEKKGIQKFDIFDYSFDDEPHLVDRIEGIIQNLKRLDAIYKNRDDYLNLLAELAPMMQNNYDTLINNIKNLKFLMNPTLEHLLTCTLEGNGSYMHGHDIQQTHAFFLEEK